MMLIALLIIAGLAVAGALCFAGALLNAMERAGGIGEDHE